MARVAIGGPLGLERFDLWTENVSSTIEHPANRSVDFRLQFPIGCTKVEEGDHALVILNADIKSL